MSSQGSVLRSKAHPLLDLEAACGLLQTDLEKLGPEPWSRADLAEALGYQNGSGGVAARKISSLVQFGFLDRRRKEHRLSELGRALRMDLSGRERLRVLRQAIWKPALYRELLSELAIEQPVPAGLERRMQGKGITAKASAAAAEVFLLSARFVGYFSTSAESSPPVYESSAKDSEREALLPLKPFQLMLSRQRHGKAFLELPRDLIPEDLDMVAKQLQFQLNMLKEHLDLGVRFSDFVGIADNPGAAHLSQPNPAPEPIKTAGKVNNPADPSDR